MGGTAWGAQHGAHGMGVGGVHTKKQMMAHQRSRDRLELSLAWQDEIQPPRGAQYTLCCLQRHLLASFE